MTFVALRSEQHSSQLHSIILYNGLDVLKHSVKLIIQNIFQLSETTTKQ